MTLYEAVLLYSPAMNRLRNQQSYPSLVQSPVCGERRPTSVINVVSLISYSHFSRLGVILTHEMLLRLLKEEGEALREVKQDILPIIKKKKKVPCVLWLRSRCFVQCLKQLRLPMR